jgi:hypothetical protein
MPEVLFRLFLGLNGGHESWMLNVANMENAGSDNSDTFAGYLVQMPKNFSPQSLTVCRNKLARFYPTRFGAYVTFASGEHVDTKALANIANIRQDIKKFD